MPNRISELITKYLEGTLTVNEEIELNEWLEQSPKNKSLYDELTNENSLQNSLKEFYSLQQNIQRKTNAGIHEFEATLLIKKKRRKIFFATIVSLLLIIAISTILFFTRRSPTNNSFSPIVYQIPRGTNKAVVILSDGKTIDLDSTNDGVLSFQSNTVTKNKSSISYASGNIQQTISNTIATSKGRRYQVVLPDSTKVWLNAASSITFPVTFSGERKVYLTGEAYFEVHHQDKPFSVITDNGIIQDLGTHFDVFNYSDEPISKTTLFEGKIKITTANSEKMLSPGEQEILNKKTATISVNKADLESISAWRNDQFYFKTNDIKTILREISRWYDLDIVYTVDIENSNHYSGIINHSEQLSAIITSLQNLCNIKLTLKGRQLIVE